MLEKTGLPECLRIVILTKGLGLLNKPVMDQRGELLLRRGDK